MIDHGAHSNRENTAFWYVFVVRWTRRLMLGRLRGEEKFITSNELGKTLDDLQAQAVNVAREKAKVSATGESFLLQSYLWPGTHATYFPIPVAMWRFKAGETEGILESHWNSSVGAAAAGAEAAAMKRHIDAIATWQ